MESDGRRRLRKLHCMKCGAPLATSSTPPPALPSASPSASSPSPPAAPTSFPRLVCTAPGCSWVFYNNPLPVVAALVEHDDGSGGPDSRGVLLVRGRGWPASWFGLVTGFLEAGEDPAQAAVREVKEELGVDGVVESFLGLYAFPRMNQLIMAYHVKLTPGELRVTLQEEEIEAYKKVPLHKLRPWSEGTGHAVRDFLIQQTGSSPPNLDSAFKRRPTQTRQLPAPDAAADLVSKL